MSLTMHSGLQHLRVRRMLQLRKMSVRTPHWILQTLYGRDGWWKRTDGPESSAECCRCLRNSDGERPKRRRNHVAATRASAQPTSREAAAIGRSVSSIRRVNSVNRNSLRSRRGGTPASTTNDLVKCDRDIATSAASPDTVHCSDSLSRSISMARVTRSSGRETLSFPEIGKVCETEAPPVPSFCARNAGRDSSIAVPNKASILAEAISGEAIWLLRTLICLHNGSIL